MTTMMGTIEQPTETVELAEERAVERPMAQRIAEAAETMRALKQEKANLPDFYERAVRRTDTAEMVRLKRRMAEIDEHIAAMEVTIARLDVERARHDLDEALAREGAHDTAEYDQLLAMRERKRTEYEDAQRACIQWQGALQGAQHATRHRRERLWDANARLDALIARITQAGDQDTATEGERTAEGHRVMRMGPRPDGEQGG